jgi:cytochrome c553
MKKIGIFFLGCLFSFQTTFAAESAQELFKTCAGCHGEKGEKNALGYSDKIEGWKPEQVKKALYGYREGTYGGLMTAVMKKQAENLTKEEIEILAAYIPTLGKRVERDGAALYKRCAGCHGMQGENVALGGSKVIQKCSKKDLIKKLKGYRDGAFSGLRVPIMEEQVADLSDKDIEILATYITGFKKSKQCESAASNLARGKDIFQICAGCHGEKGEKNALSYSAKIQGWDKERVIKAIQGYQKGTYGGLMGSVMQKEVSKLKEEDIQNVAAYISTLGKEVQQDGVTLFKRCATCHGVRAENVALGGSKVIQGWDANKTYATLKAYQDGNITGLMAPIMEEEVKNLSDKDLKVLSEYVETLK